MRIHDYMLMIAGGVLIFSSVIILQLAPPNGIFVFFIDLFCGIYLLVSSFDRV